MAVGVPILYWPYANLDMDGVPLALATTSGSGSLITGVLLIALGLALWFRPHQRVFAGLATLLLALISFPVANFGGLSLGLTAGLVGGCLACSWTPPDPAEPPPSGTDRRPGRSPPHRRQPTWRLTTPRLSPGRDHVPARLNPPSAHWPPPPSPWPCTSPSPGRRAHPQLPVPQRAPRQTRTRHRPPHAPHRHPSSLCRLPAPPHTTPPAPRPRPPAPQRHPRPPSGGPGTPREQPRHPRPGAPPHRSTDHRRVPRAPPGRCMPTGSSCAPPPSTARSPGFVDPPTAACPHEPTSPEWLSPHGREPLGS
ncbi:DUF6114 domain-containing protein [Streptomyces sp. NPDC038707]|uniref:DUF6114 domain-containing protein n=1 Tax=Streptomyces sp. NPDC038707 TaxID=3154329 RepID=UPI0033C34F9F